MIIHSFKDTDLRDMIKKDSFIKKRHIKQNSVTEVKTFAALNSLLSEETEEVMSESSNYTD